MNPITSIATVLLTTALLSGCAQYENQRGVEAAWTSAATQQLTRGQSKRADVLALFGPPSQVLAMEDETALYYLFERSRGEGLILVVYNRMQIDTRYDRAIFFFDGDDVLTDFSTRIAGIEEN